MATYAEIGQIWQDPALLNKVRVAVIVAAETIRAEAPATPDHAARLVWAKGAIADPDGTARTMLNAVLAQNAGAAVGAITGASDAQVQTAVDNAVAFFV